METLYGIPSSRRKSHLDSASYRTLSRIFSICHELSHKPQSPNLHVTIGSVADEQETSTPAKFENPKSYDKIESLQRAVEKIDPVERQNPNSNATISSVAVENKTSDSRKFENSKLDCRKFENSKLDETVEVLQLVSKKFGSMEPQNANLDGTLCSVADNDQTGDPDLFDNSKSDKTFEASQLSSKKFDSMEFQKPNPNATLSSVVNEDQTSYPDKFENTKLDGTVEALQLVVENIDSMDEVEIDISSNNERLNSMVSDLSLLVGGPVDQIQSGLGKFAPEREKKLSLEGELNHEKNQNRQIEVDKISVHKIEPGMDAVLDLTRQAIASANEIEQSGVEERLKGVPCKETIETKLVENMELLPYIGEEIQLEPPNEFSILGSSNHKLNGSIEEGEITDDAQDLDDESDLDNKAEPVIDDESEDDLADTSFDVKLASKDNVPGVGLHLLLYSVVTYS
jgi:hypothetical protein